MVKETEVSFLS